MLLGGQDGLKRGTECQGSCCLPLHPSQCPASKTQASPCSSSAARLKITSWDAVAYNHHADSSISLGLHNSCFVQWDAIYRKTLLWNQKFRGKMDFEIAIGMQDLLFGLQIMQGKTFC